MVSSLINVSTCLKAGRYHSYQFARFPVPPSLINTSGLSNPFLYNALWDSTAISISTLGWT